MRTNRRNATRRAPRTDEVHGTPESDTPLWHKYYLAMRKRVKFPRYYKHALNW